MNKPGKGFTRDMSLMLKGVAILLMMWHHCFLAGRFEAYDIVFSPLAPNQVANIAKLFKFCITLFIFISGYGLYSAYRNKNENVSNGKWILLRYIKGFSAYWFIFVLSIVVCMLIDGRPKNVFYGEGFLKGSIHLIINFLGLHNIFGTQNINAEWWYMSAYFLFIMLTPLLYQISEKYGSLFFTLLVIVFPRVVEVQLNAKHIYTFLLVFVMGMIFNKEKVFERVDQLTVTAGKKCLVILLLLFLAFSSYKLFVPAPKDKYLDVIFGLFPLIYILLFYLIIPYLPFTQKVLRIFGTHSTNIYLIHNFLRSMYLKDFIYTRGHFTLIILTLLLMSLALSFSIEGLKRLVRYPVMINKLETLVSRIELS